MRGTNIADFRIESNKTLQVLAHVTKEALAEEFPNRNLGFAILVFDFGLDAMMNYVSNAKREDMIKSLRGTADALEAGAKFK